MKDFFSLLLQKENGCFCIPRGSSAFFLEEVKKQPYLFFYFSGKLFMKKDVSEIKKTILFSHQDKKGIIIFIEYYGYRVESQNSLLKTLEEIPPHIYIIFSRSSDKDLLPTIISRCILFSPARKNIKNCEASSVLQMSPSTRITHKEVIRILKKQKKEDESSDESSDDSFKQELDFFIRDLLEESYKKRVKNEKDKKNINRCIEIYDYLKEPRSTPKNILEYILLTLP